MKKTTLTAGILILAALLAAALAGCSSTGDTPEGPQPPPDPDPGLQTPADPDPEPEPEPDPEPDPDPEPEPNPEPEPEPNPSPLLTPATDVPPYSGKFVPEEYALHLENALGRKIALWARFPFSPVFIYFPEIDPETAAWTVYIAEPAFMSMDNMEADELIPLAQTLTLPGDIDFDTATPVYTGSGGGSGELEVIVELRSGSDTAYVSWDNFTWTGPDDALVLVYRGPVEPWRLQELAEYAPEVEWVIN